MMKAAAQVKADTCVSVGYASRCTRHGATHGASLRLHHDVDIHGIGTDPEDAR